MLLIIEKGIRGGICQSIYRYAKANNRYMKNYVKSIESSFIEYLDEKKMYGWVMPQNLPVNGFKWVKHLSQFNKSLLRNYDQNSDIGYFLEAGIDYPEKVFNPHKELP